MPQALACGLHILRRRMETVDKDEADRLERDLSSAISKFRQGIGGKAAIGYEKQYGIAYQNLVKAGLRHQIKAKYRAF
jgi:hypothetical protein